MSKIIGSIVFLFYFFISFQSQAAQTVGLNITYVNQYLNSQKQHGQVLIKNTSENPLIINKILPDTAGNVKRLSSSTCLNNLSIGVGGHCTIDYQYTSSRPITTTWVIQYTTQKTTSTSYAFTGFTYSSNGLYGVDMPVYVVGNQTSNNDEDKSGVYTADRIAQGFGSVKVVMLPPTASQWPISIDTNRWLYDFLTQLRLDNVKVTLLLDNYFSSAFQSCAQKAIHFDDASDYESCISPNSDSNSVNAVKEEIDSYKSLLGDSLTEIILNNESGNNYFINAGEQGSDDKPVYCADGGGCYARIKSELFLLEAVKAFKSVLKQPGYSSIGFGLDIAPTFNYAGYMGKYTPCSYVVMSSKPINRATNFIGSSPSFSVVDTRTVNTLPGTLSDCVYGADWKTVGFHMDEQAYAFQQISDAISELGSSGWNKKPTLFISDYPYWANTPVGQYDKEASTIFDAVSKAASQTVTSGSMDFSVSEIGSPSNEVNPASNVGEDTSTTKGIQAIDQNLQQMAGFFASPTYHQPSSVFYWQAFDDWDNNHAGNSMPAANSVNAHWGIFDSPSSNAPYQVKQVNNQFILFPNLMDWSGPSVTLKRDDSGNQTLTWRPVKNTAIYNVNHKWLAGEKVNTISDLEQVTIVDSSTGHQLYSTSVNCQVGSLKSCQIVLPTQVSQLLEKHEKLDILLTSTKSAQHSASGDTINALSQCVSQSGHWNCHTLSTR
ncbi:hypothetical protein M9194_04620 [Vibrio sp. S4M6]|uniref:hypothetical protein n=1 Tax=Vibrio sinus TaxID=2946865 RepID=UPI00202A2709|nr:hypothetical protein [Vibrio sinus]MCL9780720.1 hypothetical protein [Vibrio sinus]